MRTEVLMYFFVLRIIVYSTDRSEAVVPILFLFCVAL